MKISGAIAVVTGAARGIGKAYVEILLENGAKVCFGDVLADEGRQTESEFKQKFGDDSVTFVVCDVSKDEDVEGLFEVAKARWGRASIVVANAGVLGEYEWQRTVQINLCGVIRTVSAGLQHMSKVHGGSGGVVIFTASKSGLYPEEWAPVYAATKHAVIAYARSWAAPNNVVKTGVRMSVLCPGSVDTPFLDDVTPEKLLMDTLSADVVTEDKLSPRDIAELIIPLICDESKKCVVLEVYPGTPPTEVQFRKHPYANY